MKRICFVLSSHGFGHMARNLPLIQELATRDDIENLPIFLNRMDCLKVVDSSKYYNSANEFCEEFCEKIILLVMDERK